MVTIRSKTGTFEKKIIKDRLKFLKEHITDKIKEDKGNRIKQVAESIWWINGGKICVKVKNMAESQKKGQNSTLYKKHWRKKNRKQRRISEVLWKITTSKATRKPTRKKSGTRDKRSTSKNYTELKKVICKMKNSKSGDRSRQKV